MASIPTAVVPTLTITTLAVAPLHREFTIVGPASLAQFLGMQVLVAITIAVLILVDRQLVPGPRLTPPGHRPQLIRFDRHSGGVHRKAGKPGPAMVPKKVANR
jgi:hypothetical protein